MSGATVAYHLRPNKAVDRLLFLDLLQRVNQLKPIHNYRYISFGGPTLEDFKMIHSSFGIKEMISLEAEKWLVPRQKFNLPVRCIECRHQNSSDFIEEYVPNGNTVIWLDYATPKEVRGQIQELQMLLSKIDSYDIVKITLNANPYALYRTDPGKPEFKEIQQEKRLEELKVRIGDFVPNHITPEYMDWKKYPTTLCLALETAIKEAMASRVNVDFVPLTAFSYADSEHQMLTLTGILLPTGKKKNFLHNTSLNKWEFRMRTWDSPQRINVPALSAKEKLEIDKWLPSKAKKGIHKKLKFQFHKQAHKSIDLLENYMKYYRHYPSFHRVLY